MTNRLNKFLIIILLTLSSLLLVGCSPITKPTKETIPCSTGMIQPEFNIGDEVWYGFDDDCGQYRTVEDSDECSDETEYYHVQDMHGTEDVFNSYEQRFKKGVIYNMTYNFEEQTVRYFIEGYMGYSDNNGTSFVGRTRQEAVKKFQQFVLDNIDKKLGDLADAKQNLFNQFNK